MSIKEADRLGVMRQIDKGKISLRKAAKELGLSLRHTIRIKKRYFEEGERGLISRHKGKVSPNRIPREVRDKVMSLIKRTYPDFGPTLAQEKLRERHEITVSAETLRNWMIEEGLWKAKKKKGKRVYQRRTRRSRFGEMIQGDGSHHDWFEGRGDKCCLILFVDDATSMITEGRFSPSETTEDYLVCLENHLKRYGRPVSLYVDKHSIFRVNREEIKKGTGITQFGRILKDFDIELICAHSPQAKGRVERKNGVLQDRLIKDMRLANICSIEEANAFLEEWIREHNQKFGKKAAREEGAHRSLRKQDNLRKAFSIRDRRKLSKDLTFQYQGVLYQLKTNTPNRLRHAYVNIFWRTGEAIEVEYNSKKLEYTMWSEKPYEQPKVLDSKELETMWKKQTTVKPSMKHPWR